MRRRGRKSQYTITLDSLQAGASFCGQFSGIAAGDDLRISVTARQRPLYLPQVRTVEISLLPDSGAGTGEGESVLIENGRHLQNRLEVSGLGIRLTGTGWKTEEILGPVSKEG